MNDGGRSLPPLTEAIRFEDVHFAYQADQPVLRGVDLTLRKGEKVGIVGPVAAGKSTLTDLLFRFYDPDQGRITVDGVDLREVQTSSLRETIALVGQHPFLFNCTLRENIAYGRVDATQEAIEAAARAANIHDEIVAMPLGYQSLAGDRGENLSGGQRQRMAIARALFKDAPILVLDEATSALDASSERQVQDALDYLMVGRTSLVIAHRLATIRDMDRIVVLEKGRITGQGTHEELMRDNPTYAQFVALQGSGGETPA